MLLLPIEFINRVRRTIEELRVQIYRSFAKDRSLHGFRKSIRLHNQLQRQALLLNRLSVELEQGRQFIAQETDGLVEYVVCDPRSKENLQQTLFNSLKDQIKTLREHIDLVSAAHISHLTSRNMDLTFRLQRQMFVWTIVVTIATIAGVLGWERTSHLLSALLKLLHLH